MGSLPVWAALKELGPDGSVIRSYPIKSIGAEPCMRCVDEVARLQLAARRIGGSTAFEWISPELLELMALAGLTVDMWREPENRKDLGGVQEEVHPGDLPV